MSRETPAPKELLTLPFHRHMIVRGAVGVAFGLVTTFWPRDSADMTNLSIRSEVVDYLLLGFLAVSALLCVWHARAAVTPPDLRLWILGQAVVAVPAIVFLLFAETPPQIRAAVTIWALLHGLCDVMIYRHVRGAYHGASDFLITGALWVLLALILGVNANQTALSILGFTGAAALMAGVIFILGGVTAARRESRREGGPAADDPAGDAPDAPAGDAATEDTTSGSAAPEGAGPEGPGRPGAASKDSAPEADPDTADGSSKGRARH